MKKGDCFSVAGNRVISDPNFILCHAKVMGQGKLKGKRIWHAWCEVGDVVFDFSNGSEVILRKEFYYKVAKIKEKDIQKYDHDTLLKLVLKYKYHGTYPEGEIKSEN